MKKFVSAAIILLALLTLVQPARALLTPDTGVLQGYLTASLVPGGASGFSVSGQLGLWENLAVFGQLGDPYKRLGGKVQINPWLAVTGGYLIERSIFLGINLQRKLLEELTGAADLALAAPLEEAALAYELGFIYQLPENLDARISLQGLSRNYNFKLGFGYNF